MADLEQFAATLAVQRDQHIARALGAVTAATREYHVGAAVGLRYALTMLHIETMGQYGATDTDQPDPFTLVPIS